MSSQVLLPGDQITITLPEQLRDESHVTITPRQSTQLWLKPTIVKPSSGMICLTNSYTSQVKVNKSDHLAEFDLPPQTCLNKNLHEDTFQFMDFATSRSHDPEQLKKLQVDPDHILSPQERDIFHNLHKRFAKLFTTQPGKYNGSYGYINNSLQFSTPPPPNARTHIPNYSPSMNAIMAQKMDDLEAWGVLTIPE